MTERPLREKDTQHRAKEGKQNTFDEQLANDAGAAGTHGGAHGQFFLAAGDTRELHVGDIGASNQEDESHRAQEQQGVLASEIAGGEFPES